jgi:hypothetical protein
MLMSGKLGTATLSVTEQVNQELHMEGGNPDCEYSLG